MYVYIYKICVEYISYLFENELHERNVSLEDSRARLVPILQACVHLAEFYGLRGKAEGTIS